MSSPAPGSDAAGSVIVTFALPDESRAFVAALRPAVRTLHRGGPPELPTIISHCGNKLVAVVHTGVGDTPEGRERLKTIIATAEDLRGVISAGYTGGLSPSLQLGDLVLGENYSDPDLARLACAALAGQPLHVGLVTTQTAAVETVADKAALHAEIGALAVDMETRWISNVCGWAGAPMLSLRAISDPADHAFPVPTHVFFDAARQRPRYFALPWHLLTHPGRIGPFVRFVRALSPARARLAHALTAVVDAL